MSYLNIPAELRGEKAWVNVWDGSKVPMQATVRKAASSSNPDTWSNYIDAERNVQHGYYDGLGYVFHDTGVVGIDIDDGFTDGLLNPLAADIIGRCHSYTEKSRSGRGVHILVRGELPFKGKNNRAAVEIYKSNRYFIMTGEVLIFSEIIENQSAIDYVIEKYFPDTPKESSSGTVAPQRIYSPIYRLYDKNLQTIHDTNGYHFINYCVKCGKVFAAFMAEAELNSLIDRDIEQFRKERQHGRL